MKYPLTSNCILNVLTKLTAMNPSKHEINLRDIVSETLTNVEEDILDALENYLSREQDKTYQDSENRALAARAGIALTEKAKNILTNAELWYDVMAGDRELFVGTTGDMHVGATL